MIQSDKKMCTALSFGVLATSCRSLLGYGNKWQDFEKVIKKAMIACEQVGQIKDDQFTGVSKSITSDKGDKRDIDDYHTHYFVGDQVRKAIEAIQGPMPEDLPSAPSIRALVEERRRQGKRLKKKLLSNEQEKLL